MFEQNEIFARARAEVQRGKQRQPARRSSSGEGSGVSSEPAIIPDLGILKGIQGMGDKLTKGFETLTHKISAVASSSLSSNSSSSSNPHRGAENDMDNENTELHPLVQQSNTVVSSQESR